MSIEDKALIETRFDLLWSGMTGIAFRYYDGDDRRIVVLVCDAEVGILEEFRAHFAEWLGDLYYERRPGLRCGCDAPPPPEKERGERGVRRRSVRMKSYVELVRRRLEDRGNNIPGNLERFLELQLRFTTRIFGDCLDEEARGKMFSGDSEHLAEQELRAFASPRWSSSTC